MESSKGKRTIPKPHPPVVGEVTHHSIQLSWDLENTAQRKGPQEQWLKMSIEEEDPKLHTYGTIYTGYARQHVIEGLQPRTTYRFRLKITSPTGDCAYSPAVSVSTTREPMSGEQLHRAVSMNDVEAVLNILQGGHVKVDVPDKLGFTALMVASQKGYDRLAKILVQNGTDVNQKNGSGKDSLMLACFAGHLDIIKYLREQGASWEVRDLGGCTALHWAVDGGHCEVIEWMINDGCQVAVLNNHEELIQLLLDKGADATVKNEYGKGLLEMARSLQRYSVVTLLEENKRKLNENTNFPPPVLGSQAREVTK
ncbi:fibronectin type 3 and ankyrin repeat domains protein 1 isoform X2 [Malaclemys terrapin pileata]|uniref:fibronectin type 3 and ankyrin repeat domains protein 1 isoform X2 n=1 Tax=Malaclemys terrapin pileata TaxID=2991368 RepID=UPI0023A7A27D|nr:fibronectin type 3 and ankyrin repeat domains protein 1 isoform X2 [Malaclemys terrapin pileata]